MNVAVITVSDACARGARRDASGDAIAEWIVARGDTLVSRVVIPDENVEIVRALLAACDTLDADLVLTTGGTGLSPRDVTPEATCAVLDRDAPGIAELIRASAMPTFPRAALSRGTAGARGGSLVINLAGSPSAVRDGLAAIQPIVDHASEILRGKPSDHGGVSGDA